MEISKEQLRDVVTIVLDEWKRRFSNYTVELNEAITTDIVDAIFDPEKLDEDLKRRLKLTIKCGKN
jgi:hypothetical protein